MNARRLIAAVAVLVIVLAASIGWVLRANPVRLVDAWLAAHPELEVVGVGRIENLPLDIDIYPLTYVVSEGCDFLDARHPQILVLDLETLEREAARDADRIRHGEINYRPVLEVRPAALMRTISGMIGRTAPALQVLERTARPCLRPERDLGEALAILRGEEDPHFRAALAWAVRSYPLPFKKYLGGPDLDIQGVGILYDGWSRGTEPMAIVFSNASTGDMAPRLTIGCEASRADLPVTVTIDDGIDRLTRRFDGKGRRTVTLPSVAAGDSRLVLVWSDKAWQAAGGAGRWLGASVLDATLVEPVDS